MRCRLVTRDIPNQANARDFAHLNLKTSLEVIWGDHPIDKGLVVLLEVDLDRREATEPVPPPAPAEAPKRGRRSEPDQAVLS